MITAAENRRWPGDIEIAEQSSVWPNVTLRGDDGPIRIGSQTSIQDNTVIHCTEGWSFTTVGSRVTVGHSVILHGCTPAELEPVVAAYAAAAAPA